MLIEEALATFKKHLNESRLKTISFDFDSTLTEKAYQQTAAFGLDSIAAGPHRKNHRLFKEYQRKGHKVIIVTRRDRDRENIADIKGFCKHFDLEPEEIHFTDGKDKVHTLLKLRSEIHYDDDPREIAAIEKHGKGKIKGILVK